jgi:hypothetical protein
VGYQGADDEEEEKKDGIGSLPSAATSGPKTPVVVGEIRKRQGSCYIKDLNPDEVPEFWKQNFENG